MRTLPLEYSLRGLTRGRGRTLLALAGALVAGALIATASAFLGGMEAALGSTASASRVIVMGAGSEESLERSEIGARVPGVLSASVQGIRRTAGMEHVSAETHVALPIAHGGDASNDNGLARGVGRLGHADRQHLRCVVPLVGGRGDVEVGSPP
jgi:putative ABC transport system permease protein